MNPQVAAFTRSARDRAIDCLRAVDDVVEPTLHPKRLRRLIFDGSSPFEFAMFRPIHERLKRDRRLEVFFTASRLDGSPRELYRGLGVSASQVLSRRRARWMKFDVHVSAQYFTIRLIRTALKVHIFHGVGGKAWNISEKARAYDRLFLVSEFDRRRFIDAGIFPEGSPALEVIGMPKTDCLVDGSLRRDEILRAFRLPPERPAIAYVPTWQETSSLYTMGRELMATLADGPWSVIVKLHDNCYRSELSGGVDWEGELSSMGQRANVRVIRQPDVSPVLAAADMLISDLSSASLEYLLLDRPVIVADAPELFARYARDEVSTWQRQLGPLLRDPKDVTALVRRVLERPGDYGDVRRTVASKIFHDPGYATDRAVASLYRLLRLAPIDRRAVEAA